MADIRIGVKAYVEKVWRLASQCCSRDIAVEGSRKSCTDGKTERRAKKGGDTFHQAEEWCSNLLVSSVYPASTGHTNKSFLASIMSSSTSD